MKQPMNSKDNQTDTERLLTVQEAAKLLGVKVSFLYELSRPGNPQIPSIKLGKKYRRFRWTDLIGYFENRNKN